MSHIASPLVAISIVTNTWEQSQRFYTEGLGYSLLETGELTNNQRLVFGKNLKRFALFGHTEGSVVRLIETTDTTALPNRMGARPFDLGMAVFEAGTADVEKAYYKVLRARFGGICEPIEFDCEAPEPLGYVLMKSTAFIGAAGEQVFVTQIVGRRGGVSLLKEKAVDGINVPANVVLSLKTRAQQDFYRQILGIYPVNDLPMAQPSAAKIMGGAADMAFQMCLMGNATERIGMEQHIYGDFHPDYDYQIFPCSFEKTGLASAAWRGADLGLLKDKLSQFKTQNSTTQTQNPKLKTPNTEGVEILGNVGLPIRGEQEPKGLVFRGVVGEILEVLE